MKTKMACFTALLFIALILLSGNTAYPLSSNIRTEHVIHIRLIITGDISMNLEDEWIHRNLQRPEVEAFSESMQEGLLVDKFKRGDSTVWLFTKTK